MARYGDTLLYGYAGESLLNGTWTVQKTDTCLADATDLLFEVCKSPSTTSSPEILSEEAVTAPSCSDGPGAGRQTRRCLTDNRRKGYFPLHADGLPPHTAY
jgi:hypothetical protein